jgi:hypothetical protein
MWGPTGLFPGPQPAAIQVLASDVFTTDLGRTFGAPDIPSSLWLPWSSACGYKLQLTSAFFIGLGFDDTPPQPGLQLTIMRSYPYYADRWTADVYPGYDAIALWWHLYSDGLYQDSAFQIRLKDPQQLCSTMVQTETRST